MEVSGQTHDTAAFFKSKEPWYPLNRRLSGPQSTFGLLENINYLALVEIRSPHLPARSETEIPWLLSTFIEIVLSVSIEDFI
jgi:hypothetical protein